MAKSYFKKIRAFNVKYDISHMFSSIFVVINFKNNYIFQFVFIYFLTIILDINYNKYQK